MRHLVLFLAALSLVSCSRDPNVLKEKYLQSGKRYFTGARYKEASIMFRKAIEADRKFGQGYYNLALTDLKLGQVAPAVPALRRAHELLKPGTPEADDTDLKLAEIMIVAAQSQEHNEALIKEVHVIVDGLTKRNPNGWEAHKLTGDLGMIETGRLYRADKAVEAKKVLEEAITEYRKALAVKTGDPLITLALGRTLVVDGESGEAETLFKGLIDKDKTNLNAYFELYRVYLSQRKLPEAEGVLKSAIKDNPKNTQLRLSLAQFYFGANKRDDLVALLKQMKSNLTEFPDAYFQSGDFYSRVSQFDEAIKQYEEGIVKDPSRKNTYLKREIEVYVREGKTDVAFKQNEVILKDDPKDPEARALKATFLLDKGEINQAMTDLQSVVTAKPDNFVARFNLGRAHFARGEYEQARQEFDTAVTLRSDYLPARLAQTQVALIRGDNEAALHAADEVLKISPGSVQGAVMKAVSLEKLKRADEARALLDAILKRNPKQEETLLELGLLDLNEKKTKDAEDLFRRAWESDSTNLRGLLGEARAYLLDNQPDKAIQIVQAEVQKNPKRLDLQSALGNTLVSANQTDKGIAVFQDLMTKVSEPRQQSDLWTRIGEAYLRKGDREQSINAIEKARQGQPNNASLLVDLAMLYETQNKMDVARKDYEQAVKMDPNNALALNNLAYLIAQSSGDLDIALTYATRAKQRLPGHPEINDTLGWIYLKKNLTDNAVDTFKTLIVQSPQNPTYHYHYAMALAQKGDRETAKKECQTALSARPRKEEEAEIRQLMTKLGA
jgi:tetratricopeptide (TPR) repeat protein